MLIFKPDRATRNKNSSDLAVPVLFHYGFPLWIWFFFSLFFICVLFKKSTCRKKTDHFIHTGPTDEHNSCEVIGPVIVIGPYKQKEMYLYFGMY